MELGAAASADAWRARGEGTQVPLIAYIYACVFKRMYTTQTRTRAYMYNYINMYV